MKYLTVSLYHPRIMKGGAQYVAKDLHDAAMADPGVEPVLLACIDGNMFPQYGKVGTPITGLPDSPGEYVLSGGRFRDFYHVVHDQRRNKALMRFLQDQKPDVIHVHHSLWVGLDFLELARKVLPDVRILYTLHEYVPICHARGQLFRYHEQSICHDSAPDQCSRCFPEITPDEFTLRRRMFRRAFGLVDHFIAPSAYLRDRYIRWGLAPERISVVPNGHLRQRPEGWAPAHSPDLNVFGFFGQYVDAKGIDVLLRAAAQVAQSTPVEIKIFGGNKQYATEDYLARIEAILEGAPADLTVTEVGAYSRENVFDLMTLVDWVVMPSVWPETFGLVVSEAWDARRPVIAARAGGLGERIVEGRNGFGFPPGSDLHLAEIMRRCIGNRELWAQVTTTIEDEIALADAWARHRALIAGLPAAAGGETAVA